MNESESYYVENVLYTEQQEDMPSESFCSNTDHDIESSTMTENAEKSSMWNKSYIHHVPSDIAIRQSDCFVLLQNNTGSCSLIFRADLIATNYINFIIIKISIWPPFATWDHPITNQNKQETELIGFISAIWTCSATQTLLKLYENKLGLLETPKKKTRIWLAISESLKYYNIEMSADQVRWKINALTKKYKQCLDTGQHRKFKYFKEMEDIYAKYNVDCDTMTLGECVDKRTYHKNLGANNFNSQLQIKNESRAMIELRKARLAKRIESDRTQSKLILEKQWLEFLKRQEQDKLVEDEICNRNLKLREEELELHRHELEMKQSIALQKLQLKEREQNNLVKIEKEKCEMLRLFFENKNNV